MINYNINENDRTIEASITGCDQDAIKKVKRCIGDTAMADTVLKVGMLKNTFKSKAKCHPDDIFDVEVGKSLAKKRLLTDYNNAVIKTLGKIEVVLNENRKKVISCIKHVHDVNKKHS